MTPSGAEPDWVRPSRPAATPTPGDKRPNGPITGSRTDFFRSLLKVIAAHGGGFLPAYAGRIDHAWGARSDARGTLPHAPSTYLKRIYVDAIVFTEHQLAALLALLGAGHVLMGTDYPYDMGEYDPLGHLAGLDAAQAAAIAGGNARALFGL